MTRLDILKQHKEIAVHNLYCYSENLLMTKPRLGCEDAWKDSLEEVEILEAWISEICENSVSVKEMKAAAPISAVPAQKERQHKNASIWTSIDVGLVRELYIDKNQTAEACSKELGISKTTFARVLRENGIRKLGNLGAKQSKPKTKPTAKSSKKVKAESAVEHVYTDAARDILSS